MKGQYVDAGELTDKDYVVFPIPTYVENVEESNLFYFYLYGLCLMKSKVVDGQVNLEVGEHIIGDIKKFFDEKNVSYEYQPEEKISRERYDTLCANIRQNGVSEDVALEHVDCESGACPVDFRESK